MNCIHFPSKVKCKIRKVLWPFLQSAIRNEGRLMKGAREILKIIWPQVILILPVVFLMCHFSLTVVCYFVRLLIISNQQMLLVNVAAILYVVMQILWTASSFSRSLTRYVHVPRIKLFRFGMPELVYVQRLCTSTSMRSITSLSTCRWVSADHDNS